MNIRSPLLFLIIVAAALAVLLIPKFSAGCTHSRASEVPTMLSQLVASEEAFYAENGHYIAAAHDTLYITLGVDIAENSICRYDVIVNDPQKFLITATFKREYIYHEKYMLFFEKRFVVPKGTKAWVTDQGHRGTTSNALRNKLKAYFGY